MNPTLQTLRKRALAGDAAAVVEIRDLALQAIATLNALTDIPADHPELPEALRAGAAAAHQVAGESLRWPVIWDAIQEIREPQLGKVARAGKQYKIDGAGRISRMGIGGKTGIRIKQKIGQKKPRDFGPHGISGFALDIWAELEAIRRNPQGHFHYADMPGWDSSIGGLTEEQDRRSWQNLAAKLHPFSSDSLELWVDAGTKLCEEWTEEWRLEDHPTIPDLKRVRKIPHWEKFPWINPIRSKAAEVVNPDMSEKERGAKSSIRGKIRGGFNSLLP